MIPCLVALENGAALTPPMGFSTWNHFRGNFNQASLQAVATAMVNTGMVDAGYVNFNLDDTWPRHERLSNGTLLADPDKFPNGMMYFSRWLQARNLSLGIYTAHSNLTCQKYPGSLGFETIDAQQYAEWGVSFVKNDWCAWHPGLPGTDDYKAFEALRDALNATGRPITYSVHWNYGIKPSPSGQIPLPQLANMWRVGDDIRPEWDSILRLIDTTGPLWKSAQPGAWNDCDMLEVKPEISFRNCMFY